MTSETRISSFDRVGSTSRPTEHLSACPAYQKARSMPLAHAAAPLPLGEGFLKKNCTGWRRKIDMPPDIGAVLLEGK
jgi:hypothetical protein